jgi:hypothetical protein
MADYKLDFDNKIFLGPVAQTKNGGFMLSLGFGKILISPTKSGKYVAYAVPQVQQDAGNQVSRQTNNALDNFFDGVPLPSDDGLPF